MIIGLINVIAPCITAIASCIAIYVTHKNTKESVEAAYKQIEIERNDSIRQEQRYQEEKENLELGKKTKTLMMYYYGNGEGVFQDAVDDVENGIDRVKNFTEEKWNDFKDKLE